MKKEADNSKGPRSATSASILGNLTTSPKSNRSSNGAAKVKPEWAKYYAHLLELREQLLKQMSGLAKESAQEMAGYSLHMADSGTDNFDRDFALSLLSSDLDALHGAGPGPIGTRGRPAPAPPRRLGHGGQRGRQ